MSQCKPLRTYFESIVGATAESGLEQLDPPLKDIPTLVSGASILRGLVPAGTSVDQKKKSNQEDKDKKGQNVTN